MLVFFSYCRFPLYENMFTSSGEIIFRKLTSFGSAGLTGIPPCYNYSVLGQEVGNKMKCQFSSKSLHRDYRIIFYSVSSINFTLNSIGGGGEVEAKANDIIVHWVSTLCQEMHEAHYSLYLI